MQRGLGDTRDAVRSGQQQPDAEGIELILRASRPQQAGAAVLEKRLAVASILQASGADRERPRLGRLQVQSRIGGGAMGVVYRAHDPELQRLVAVKLLRGWTGGDERAQIVHEARRLAQLTHPNVVTVHDIVNDDDGLHFTMEYVAGVTLSAWLTTHPDADFREVLDLFVQAGRGLAAAHDAGMVHRDFKPDNVLVGDDGRVRVADFGLARVVHDRDAHSLAGTPYYMAPEVAAAQPATPASDQFSYCLALRDALRGKEAPPHLNSAIERGLAVDPSQRHPGLQPIVAILSSAVAGDGDHLPRGLLLERVERLWLSGVLERSLGKGGVVDLSLAGASELVEPPWEGWGKSGRPLSAGGASPEPAQTSTRELSRMLGESNGSLLLAGPPGSGKTTSLLLLCRDLWRTATVNPAAPAPAMLSLSTYRPPVRCEGKQSDSAHFGQWIIDELVTKYGLPRPAVRRWFGEAKIVLLLDGLDETDAGLRARVVETLNHFREEHALPVVVTCRDSEYDALTTRLAFGHAVFVQPLDDGAVTDLLEERGAVHLLEQLARDEHLRELLRNPLLLTLYASGDHAIEAAESPGWVVAYARYVQEAFSETDPAARARLERQLTWLARAMRAHNTSDLWLERLTFAWIDPAWKRRLAFASGALVTGLVALGLNLAQVPLTGFRLQSATVFGFMVWLCSFAYTRGRIEPVERLRFSWRRAARLLPITVVCSSVVGLIQALQKNFTANMTGALVTGAIMALLFALEPGEREGQVRPNSGIHQSFINSLLVSFVSAVPAGLVIGLVIHPYILRPLSTERIYEVGGGLINGVAIGLFIFTAMFLIYGGFTVIMHYVLRLWLAATTPLPLRLVALLDHAVELGLMRRVGGGYVFLHRTLLGYFADGGSSGASATGHE